MGEGESREETWLTTGEALNGPLEQLVANVLARTIPTRKKNPILVFYVLLLRACEYKEGSSR